MPGYAVVLIIIVFIVIIANAVVLIVRSRKTKSPYGRRGKKAPTEEKAMKIRDNEIQRRIDMEQERIKKYLYLRSKTWDLYEEVRQRHKRV